MELQKEVECDEIPDVPDLLRRKLGRILRGAKSLAIREQKLSNGKYGQINKILFETESPREKPPDALDDIAEQCAYVMHACWLDRESDDAINFHLQVEVLPGAPKRARPGFVIPWDPDKENREPDEDEERKTMGWEMYEHISRAYDAANGHIDELHTVIISMGAMTQAPLRAAGAQMDAASNMMGNAVTMMMANLQERYSTEAARASEEGKTRRSDQMWDRVGGLFEMGVKAAGPQFALWIAGKMGKVPPPGMSAPDSSESDDAQEEEDDASPGGVDMNQYPIAGLANLLGSSVTPHQRKALLEIVGAEVLGLFDDVFTSETDHEAVEIFQVMQTKMDEATGLQVYGILSEDQRDWFGAIMGQVDAYGSQPEADD